MTAEDINHFRAIGRAVWVGVPHGTESRIVDIWSANRSDGASLLDYLRITQAELATATSLHG
jgi:hypothetical protein